MLPEFKTNRLYLCGVKLEDAESYQKSFSDYEVIRYLSHYVPWPYPKHGAYDYIKHVLLTDQGRDHWTWALFMKDNQDEVIGAAELWRK